jgi:hypothetical protein
MEIKDISEKVVGCMNLHFKEGEDDNCLNLAQNVFLCYEKFDDIDIQLLVKDGEHDYYIIEIYNHDEFYDLINFNDTIDFSSEIGVKLIKYINDSTLYNKKIGAHTTTKQYKSEKSKYEIFEVIVNEDDDD